MDCTSTHHMLDLVEKGTVTSFGTYKLHGAYLLPNYNEGINVNLESEYKIIVKDLGIASDLERDSVPVGNHIALIVVGGGKYYEQKDLQESLNKYSDCVCILNHISGIQFYTFIQNNSPLQKMYRMVCKYDWYSNEEITDDVFSELLDDLFPLYFGTRKQKNTKLRRCISNILKNKKC